MSLRLKKYLRLLWYTLAEHEQWPIHVHYLYLSYCSLASPTIYYSSLPNLLHVCLLSFWLFFSWRITFQFSLLSNLPVHVIITLWFFFLVDKCPHIPVSILPILVLPEHKIITLSYMYISFLDDKVVTFQFLSYLFYMYMTFLPFSCVPFLADICRHNPASSRPWPLYTGSPFSCGDIYNGLTPFSHISQCWDIPQNGTQHHTDGHKASTIIALVNFFKNTSSNAKS